MSIDVRSREGHGRLLELARTALRVLWNGRREETGELSPPTPARDTAPFSGGPDSSDERPHLWNWAETDLFDEKDGYREMNCGMIGFAGPGWPSEEQLDELIALSAIAGTPHGAACSYMGEQKFRWWGSQDEFLSIEPFVDLDRIRCFGAISGGDGNVCALAGHEIAVFCHGIDEPEELAKVLMTNAERLSEVSLSTILSVTVDEFEGEWAVMVIDNRGAAAVVTQGVDMYLTETSQGVFLTPEPLEWEEGVCGIIPEGNCVGWPGVLLRR